MFVLTLALAYGLFCVRLSVFVWTCALAFLSVSTDSCSCACVSQCMDSCACVSQCLYGLLWLRLRLLSSQRLYGLLLLRLHFSVFVWTLALRFSVFVWTLMIALVLASLVNTRCIANEHHFPPCVLHLIYNSPMWSHPD